ncbi:hypothetical protein ABT342_30020, partial [Streptomyces sp. NPDC000410]
MEPNAAGDSPVPEFDGASPVAGGDNFASPLDGLPVFDAVDRIGDLVEDIVEDVLHDVLDHLNVPGQSKPGPDAAVLPGTPHVVKVEVVTPAVPAPGHVEPPEPRLQAMRMTEPQEEGGNGDGDGKGKAQDDDGNGKGKAQDDDGNGKGKAQDDDGNGKGKAQDDDG